MAVFYFPNRGGVTHQAKNNLLSELPLSFLELRIGEVRILGILGSWTSTLRSSKKFGVSNKWLDTLTRVVTMHGLVKSENPK